MPSLNEDKFKHWKVLGGVCIVFVTSTAYLFIFEILYNEKLFRICGGGGDNNGNFTNLHNISQNLQNHTIEESVAIHQNKEFTAHWTFTIYLLMWNFTSVFVGPMSEMLSHRLTTSIGIFLMGSGTILSSFAKSSVDIFLSVGLISGSGQGLVTNTAIILLQRHFKEKQGLALGISFMVMALSGMVNLHMVRGFLSFFDVVTSIQLYGAFIILGLLGSAFFYEPEINEEFKKKSSNINTNNLVNNINEGEEDKIMDLENNAKNTNNIIIENSVDHQQINNNHSKIIQQSKWKQNPIVKMFTLINWSLLKQPHFLLTAIGSSYSFNALFTFYLYLPLFADTLPCCKEYKSNFMSVIAGIDLFTRFLFAWVGDLKCTHTIFLNHPRRILYAITVIGMSLAMIALPFCQTYECVMASSVFWGFFAGGIPGNGPMVYSESFKKDLASSQGLASIGRALAALSMGPLANIAKTKDNGVYISLWATGGISMALMIIWIVEFVYLSCFRKNNL